MSVSDPLLKDLKAFILEFHSTKSLVISDKHEKLDEFCETLEQIFRKGHRTTGKWFSKSDYWDWISSLSGGKSQQNQVVNPIFSMVVRCVSNCEKTKKTQGRGRYFIRFALAKKVLSIPVEMLTKNPQLLESLYDPLSSIIGNEILREILMSLLFEITEISFLLNLKNTSFLDETWKLPPYVQHEFVPCKDLGISIQFIKGRAFVLSVQKGSVAEEDNKIQPGDILDDLYSECMKGSNKRKIQSLLREGQGSPVYVGLIKSHHRDGQYYTPLVDILRDAQVDIESLLNVVTWADNPNKEERTPAHALLPDEDFDELPIHGPEGSIEYPAYFVGHLNLGKDGRVDRVEDAVANVLNSGNAVRIPISVRLTETEVIVTHRLTRETVYRHCYTEISACGRRLDHKLNFSYIAGETSCSIADDFNCYVYEARTDEEARTILCTIAQGFGRTQWFL